MYRGIIQHVCNSEPFADHYFFYSFTEVCLHELWTVFVTIFFHKDIKRKKLARKKIAAKPEIYMKLQFDEAKVLGDETLSFVPPTDSFVLFSVYRSRSWLRACLVSIKVSR